jgi:hypothetical protein
MGLSPAQADLSWVQVDNYIWGYEMRMQKQMEGHRLTAFFLYRAHFEARTQDLSSFYSLPLIDSAAKSSEPNDGSPDENRLSWLIQKKVRFEARFDWNPEPGTPEHAALEAARREAAAQAAVPVTSLATTSAGPTLGVTPPLST